MTYFEIVLYAPTLLPQQHKRQYDETKQRVGCILKYILKATNTEGVCFRYMLSVNTKVEIQP